MEGTPKETQVKMAKDVINIQDPWGGGGLITILET